ncbi:MBL fold metallo-hydrolase [Laceyella putida]|uniref:MBL fold metallo-hydrolase n=1 Tax=Laceyella putida TaxID=110101 RepID=A0ABW2RFJ2_9BACL
MDKAFEDEFIPPMTSIKSGNSVEITADLICHTIQIVNICMVGNPHRPDPWFLVDAGMPHSAPDIIALAEQRFGSRRPRAILLTHGHFDHVGAIVELIEHWDVPVYAHELELPYLTGKADYPPGDPQVAGGMVSDLSPWFPNHGIRLQGQVKALPTDGSVPHFPEWRVIHTPGHTPGHISLFRKRDRSLIVGDAFVTVKQESLYKVMLQIKEISGPPKYFTTDWQAAKESVKRLAALAPAVAITGHGIPMDGAELTQALDQLVTEFDRIALPEQGRYVH